MTTLKDRLKDTWKNYRAPTPEEVKKGRKEERLIAGEGTVPEQKDKFGFPKSKKLSMAKCRTTAEQCPLFMKGARKKASDSVRAWHETENYDRKKKPAAVDLQLIKNFERRSDLRRKWRDAKVAKFVYGDSYLLITFDNDEETKLHDPPSIIKNDKNEKIYVCPYTVKLLNSECIKDIDYFPDKKAHYKSIFVKHFHYVDNKEGRDDWIHPDRIIHFVSDRLPYREFGTSKVNLLRNIIKSTINIDIACGEILSWFAHGMLDIMQEGGGEAEEKKWKDIADKHPGAWIHDETAQLKAINPQAIDPKPFYEYMVLKIASAFVMPTHILTGIQVGKVTGAEVGTGDYVKDIKDEQDLDDTPLLERLYAMILSAKGRTWKYNIVWNPIYIDELAEAEILVKRVTAADLAFNGSRGVGGFISDVESRRIFNVGQIQLDADKVPKLKAPQLQQSPQKDEDDDDDEEEKPGKKEKKKENLYDYQLDVATKAMIEKRKKQWAQEKKIAKEVEEEQNDSAKGDSKGSK